MNRQKELEAIIAQAQAELEGLPPVQRMDLREFAAAAGFSVTTASEIRNSTGNPTLANLKRALPFLGECPCCGAPVDPERTGPPPQSEEPPAEDTEDEIEAEEDQENDENEIGF